MPKALTEQWHLHRVPKDVWPLGRDPPEHGTLLPQALPSGLRLSKFSFLQRPFPSPGYLFTLHRCSCRVLVELESGRSEHLSFPAGLFCSIRKFGDAWEGADKSRYGCSTGFMLVWVFMALCCLLALLCVRRESGQAGRCGVTQTWGVQTDRMGCLWLIT